MIATAIAVALHIFGAVVWVGGMFAVYVCLRPALSTVELAPRLRLMRATLGNFFAWVWIALLLLVITVMEWCSLPSAALPPYRCTSI